MVTFKVVYPLRRWASHMATGGGTRSMMQSLMKRIVHIVLGFITFLEILITCYANLENLGSLESCRGQTKHRVSGEYVRQ